MKSTIFNNINYQENPGQLGVNKKKLIKFGAFLFFMWYGPAYINTLIEKKSGKIQYVDEVTTKNIAEIFTLMDYEKNSRVLLGSDDNLLDIGHSRDMQYITVFILDKLLGLPKDSITSTYIIKAGKGILKSYKETKTIHQFCKISTANIQEISKKLCISREETHSLLALLISLSLGEKIETAQKESFFVEFTTKSGGNKNDLNGNILGVIRGINNYQNSKYHINTDRMQQILKLLESRYSRGNAQHYLYGLQQEFGFSIFDKIS